MILEEYIQQLNKLDPSPKFKYEVKFIAPQIVNDALNLSSQELDVLCWNCIEASLPGRQLTSVDYRYVGPVRKQYYNSFYDDVTFTFLCTSEKFMERKFFDTWHELIYDNKYNMSYLDDIKGQIEVFQHDFQKNQVYGIRIIDAYPIIIDSTQLSSQATDYQTVTVKFTSRDWEAIPYPKLVKK